MQVQQLAWGISQKSLAWKFWTTLSQWKTFLNNVSIRFSYHETWMNYLQWNTERDSSLIKPWLCMCPLFFNLFLLTCLVFLWSMNGKCTLHLWWTCGNTNYGLLNRGLNHFNLIFFFCTAVNNLLKISNNSSKQRCEKRMSHGIWDDLNSKSPMPVCLPELAEIYEFQNGTANRQHSEWHLALSLISWGTAP